MSTNDILMKSRVSIFVFVFSAFIMLAGMAAKAQRIPLTVDENIPGAPQLLGVPFPEGVLASPENVRVVTGKGKEIPSQITVVNTWEPADKSIKWIWVFFFSEKTDDYFLEYGKDVSRKPYEGEKVIVENNQRSYGRVQVNTGPLRFTIDRQGSGFLDKVELDTERNGFDDNDVIAEADSVRGTFLDLFDKAGLDPSRAVVIHTVKEKGSGPLHAIIRVEGEYRYSREDNNPSPFVMRIHAYAGKPYIRILHSFVYTGEPDNHEKPVGEYAALATQNEDIIDQEKLKDAEGWTEPNDRIAAAGYSLDYNFSDRKELKVGYFDGSWSEPGAQKVYGTTIAGSDDVSILQTGPNLTRVPPVDDSTPEELIGGFISTLSVDGKQQFQKERVPGWMSVSDEKWGIGVGIRNFFKEYPKEIAIEGGSNRLYSFIWSPSVEPLGFPRADGDFDSGLVGNFAQGLAKTTEKVFYFYKKDTPEEEIQQVFSYFLEPPVAHVDPDWYASSKVYGTFAASSEKYSEFERGLDYKLKWWEFNQNWEPWYGMLDYGDGKTYYINNEWYSWTNNEPATDYMWWLQFMRTGNRNYYLNAWATSLHTMDVDNIHWPTFPDYRGDTNDALDYFNAADTSKSSGTPYLGMGRRHANQHYTSLLSAHVWVPGWIASYYLAGNHRGLEVAEQTGDYYLRRVFGDHGLRGRRLYLSIWNLVELYDATKKQIYFDELQDRVELLLELQKDRDQNGSLNIDRYGYAQVYISQGLYKYYQLTGSEEVKDALVTHARWVRDNPPLNHKMESYLASIHSLLVGYEFSKDRTLLKEALARAQVLKTDKLPREPEEFETQKALAAALEEVSKLPDDPESSRGAIWKITNGLRIFGWTHIYNIPSLIYWLEQEDMREDTIGSKMERKSK